MLTNLFSQKNHNKPTSDVIDILRLIRSENVGPKTFFSLLKMFGNAKDAIDNIADFAIRGGRQKRINVCSTQAAEAEIEKLHKIGADIICYNDPAFSSLLKYIPDCPPVLSYKGNKNFMSQRSVAVVGSRNASLNGRSFASQIAATLAKHGLLVVSGLARGIDTAAHMASAENTIAVIAGGIDHIYPPENAKLFGQIAEQGIIIAELPVGSVPLGQHFPQRNRIISGLSLAVVVVEASLKSGSLITARLAVEQGREVFAVPGFPLDPRCMGANKLIKDGAYLVESVDDIIQNLPNLENLASHLSDKQQDTVDFKTIKIDYALLSDKNRQVVMGSLSAVPASFDDVVNSTDLPIPVIYTILLEFELAGRVVRHPGNKFSLIY